MEGASFITSVTGGILQVETKIVLAVDAMLSYIESKRNRINIWVLENRKWPCEVLALARFCHKHVILQFHPGGLYRIQTVTSQYHF